MKYEEVMSLPVAERRKAMAANVVEAINAGKVDSRTPCFCIVFPEDTICCCAVGASIAARFDFNTESIQEAHYSLFNEDKMGQMDSMEDWWLSFGFTTSEMDGFAVYFECDLIGDRTENLLRCYEHIAETGRVPGVMDHKGAETFIPKGDWIW